MGSTLRNFALVAVGFAVGVAVTLLIRREPSPPPAPAPRVESTLSTLTTPPPKAQASPPAPIESEVATPAPTAPPAPTKLADTAREDHAIRNPQGVKFGRPEKADLEPILKATTWEKFYRLCKEGMVWGATYEDVILRRLSQELGLNEEQATALKKLFKAEQELATRTIIESCGGAAGFERKKDELGTHSKAVYEEWRRQRDVIRRTQDADYLKLMTYSQLEVVNEHLRNTEINIENSYDQDGVHYLLGGVGKPPK